MDIWDAETYPRRPIQETNSFFSLSLVLIQVGSSVSKWAVGDRVMALTNGGSYAEEVAVDAGSVFPVPDVFSDEQAGAFVETYLTAWLNIFRSTPLISMQPFSRQCKCI